MAEFWEVCIECTDRMKDQAIKMFASQFHGMANDITIAQMKVIQAVIKLVEQQPEGPTLRNVADYLGITPGATSTAVDLLVRNGILLRQINPNNRRAVCILPSQNLVELRKKLTEHFKFLFDRALNQLSEDEKNACIKASTLMEESIPRYEVYYYEHNKDYFLLCLRGIDRRELQPYGSRSAVNAANGGSRPGRRYRTGQFQTQRRLH